MSEKKEPMTPDEFAAQMAQIHDTHSQDIAMGHIKADDLLCEVLTQLGYEKGIEIYDRIYKWYE
mgnify:CR=1 FL=1